jgi:Transposase DDE domain group 1
MSLQSVPLLSFEFFPSRPVQIEISPAPLTTDPGLLPIENMVSIADVRRLRDVLVDIFIQSFDRSPGHLTFDLDAFDDLAHGNQQLIMFYAYYEQYQ